MEKPTYEDTQRALTAMQADMQALFEAADRICIQIGALSKRHEIERPPIARPEEV